jgi:hypothetical protein
MRNISEWMEHVIARADRRAAHQVGGDRVSDALSQVEAVGDDGAHRLEEVLLAPDDATALIAAERQTEATAVRGVDGDKAGFKTRCHAVAGL